MEGTREKTSHHSSRPLADPPIVFNAENDGH